VPESAGQTDVTRGLWYAFTAGSVRVISIANDDVTYQDGGNSYVRGYSSGAQKAWLENELSAARRDDGVDWVVVCMHQVAISTADMFNGADLGIREEWVPLFDRYGVDLVVCGHEHHYERTTLADFALGCPRAPRNGPWIRWTGFVSIVSGAAGRWTRQGTSYVAMFGLARWALIGLCPSRWPRLWDEPLRGLLPGILASLLHITPFDPSVPIFWFYATAAPSSILHPAFSHGGFVCHLWPLVDALRLRRLHGPDRCDGECCKRQKQKSHDFLPC
jgi:Calcineurin-like phosphoesterase